MTQPTDFVPAWWCRGGHAQTICASLLRLAPKVSCERQRWDTPDGDFLDVDVVAATTGAPTLLVLHGLESSSRAHPVRGMLRAAQHAGWQGVGVNFRSCSGVPNRLRRSYHAGETSDLAWVIERLTHHAPGAPLLCVGFSLGGNVLLNYLGERGDAVPSEVKAAVAISTPFDLAVAVRMMEHGISRLYMARLVRSLSQKTRAKLAQYPDLVDRRAFAAVRTLAAFDDVVTAPVHGFPSAAAYWRASSSQQRLETIRRPTLLINAQDDPLFPATALPRQISARNRWLTTAFPAAGGHLGFLSGPWPWRCVAWAENRAIAFLHTYV